MIKQRLEIPDEEVNIFIILAQNNIISKELAEKIKGMVRFRNILVHDYIDIDHEVVYNTLPNKLTDSEKFAQNIIDYI